MTDPINTPAEAEHWLPDERQLADALAQVVAHRLAHAVATRGHALLAVSGGKSPVALFRALSAQPTLAALWPMVTVLPVDERCVPTDHADSNTQLIRTHLLQGAAAAARWVPLVADGALPHTTAEATGSGTPAGASAASPTAPARTPDVERLQQLAESRLTDLPWPLDVAVLGMGLDGHTASFFPGAPGLEQALTTHGHCAWVLPDAERNRAQHARLTLSLSTLLAAQHIYLPLAGAAKHAVYQQARQQPNAELPVSLLLHRREQPVSVWLSP